MKLSVTMLLLLACSLGSSNSIGNNGNSGIGDSLLEMSQVLWSRVLDGGYRRVGKLDPLFVPVIKVDQGEGDTNYRVILRNLEIGGLNNSRIESVHIERGKLKRNLSDSEAGYVSYNEQRDLDSVRYRFHSLVKEPKQQQQYEGRRDRIVQYDPTLTRAREEQEDRDFFGFGMADSQQQQQQRFQQQDQSQYQQSRQQQQQKQPQQQHQQHQQQQQVPIQQQEQHRKNYQFSGSYSDMKVAVSSTPRNPAQVRVHYSNSFKQQQEVPSRPCIGACRRTQASADRTEDIQYQYPAEQQQQQQQQQRFYTTEAPSTKGGYAFNANVGGSSFSAESDNQHQRRTQFSLNSGSGGNANSGPGYSANYNNGQFSVEGGQNANKQFAVKSDGSGSGINFSGSYGNSGVKVEGNSGQMVDSYGQPVNRFSLNAGIPTTIRSEVTQSSAAPQKSGFQGSVNIKGAPSSVYYQQRADTTTGRPTGNVRYICDDEDDADQLKARIQQQQQQGQQPQYQQQHSQRRQYQQQQQQQQQPQYQQHQQPQYQQQQQYQQHQQQQPQQQQQQYQQRQQGQQRRTYAESTTSPYAEQFEPRQGPMVRLEKQPGYVDIVYASGEKGSGSSKVRSGNFRADPSVDPRIDGYEEIVKELSGNQRYIIHNFTEGESLKRRNDAARVAAESQRIKDLIRYAKDHQEKQGYYEEGMEFIYHFGKASNVSNPVNETLARRKRQHAVAGNEEDDDNVMHVIVRIRVPELSVKSNYALSGKVGRQLLRGNGLLTGNFSNVTADFTVELKRVDNKTLIVRAARAKIIAKDQQLKLQGMDIKGPVESILSQGLIAAEAVAAMIADDLSTKALSEGNSEDVVFKMYRNLPVIEKH